MRTKILLVAAAALAHVSGFALAQTSPTPGPTAPPPQPSPLSKPGSDMVINPTVEECRVGWNPELKWTREQFETFCVQMKAAK
jgi:hypothetical protein